LKLLDDAIFEVDEYIFCVQKDDLDYIEIELIRKLKHMLPFYAPLEGFNNTHHRGIYRLVNDWIPSTPKLKINYTFFIKNRRILLT